MKKATELPNEYRIVTGILASSVETTGRCGAFTIPIGSRDFKVVASDGEGWEHVSVSLLNRCPNWPEMCKVKNMFWYKDEEVVQFHPKEEDYINHHPYCLHMWRPTKGRISTPPGILVGPKEGKERK